jgi:hypothetical protein
MEKALCGRVFNSKPQRIEPGENADIFTNIRPARAFKATRERPPGVLRISTTTARPMRPPAPATRMDDLDISVFNLFYIGLCFIY